MLMEKRFDMKLVMASLGYGIFVISVISLLIILGPSHPHYIEPSTIQLRLVQAAVIGGFISWISLLAHFFQNSGIKHRVLWGFSLLFFWWAAGLLYLYLHFRQRKMAS